VVVKDSSFVRLAEYRHGCFRRRRKALEFKKTMWICELMLMMMYQIVDIILSK